MAGLVNDELGSTWKGTVVGYS